jgi:RHH-type proline utilization regulon transcriptional repressor/proline dehydrogenase/delta 1-pyrroline-5-carboxylate dehydrogenase
MTPWDIIATQSLTDEDALVRQLLDQAALSPADRAAITAAAPIWSASIRASTRPGLMEVFLAEYGLSTDEGIALMCLAEALLRVPDAETMDALIEDKIAPSDWGRTSGRSASSLVNASTWALMLTGKVLDDREPGVVGHLRAAVKRLGEPVIRTAVPRDEGDGPPVRAGRNHRAAMTARASWKAQGYTYSYDMLGEAARTEADAPALSPVLFGGDHRHRPRRDQGQRHPHQPRHLGQAVGAASALRGGQARPRDGRTGAPRPRAGGLARAAGLGFNIDAEEADRLALSLEVIEAVLSDPSLAGWDGFGVVVQAYGRRAGAVIDWLYALANGWTAASWCGWSRAPTGTPRSSARRCWGWPLSRSSPASRRPMSATSPTPASSWA